MSREKEDLQKQADLCVKRINFLKIAHINSQGTDAAKEFLLEQQIKEAEQQLAQIKTQINFLSSTPNAKLKQTFSLDVVFDKAEVMTEYHCYCCNRGAQHNTIMEFYHQSHEKFPHLHFFIPSTLEDKPDSFITRFLQDEDSVENYFFGTRQGNIDKILHKDILPSRCQKNIKTTIQKHLANPTSKNTGEHFEVFLFRLDIKNWQVDKCQMLLDYLSNDFQSDFSNHKILTFFWLDTHGLGTSPAQNIFQRIFKKKEVNPLPYIKQEVTTQKNMLLLPDMKPINKGEVQNWFYNYCSDTPCFNAIIDSHLYKEAQALRMGDIESFLLKLIKQ